jgi:hypothetical protein
MQTKQEHLNILAKYYLTNLIYLPIEYGCWGLDPNTKFQVIFDPTDDYDRENEILREILILADDSKWLTA